MKALGVFVIILLLIGPFFFFISGMIVMESSSEINTKNDHSKTIDIRSFGRIKTAYLHIYPVAAITVSVLMAIFLILQVKFPELSGISLAVVSLLFFILVLSAGIVEKDPEFRIFHILPFIYMYAGFFFFFIRSKRNRIIGAKGISKEELYEKCKNRGRLVVYPFTFSIIFMTYKRNSPVYYFEAGERPKAGIMWILISILFGPWGIPWGPIYTFKSIRQNIKGGIKVSPEILKNL
jgi:hypothetical protein